MKRTERKQIFLHKYYRKKLHFRLSSCLAIYFWATSKSKLSSKTSITTENVKRDKRLLDSLRSYGKVYMDHLKFWHSIPSEEGETLQKHEYADFEYLRWSFFVKIVNGL